MAAYSGPLITWIQTDLASAAREEDEEGCGEEADTPIRRAGPHRPSRM